MPSPLAEMMAKDAKSEKSGKASYGPEESEDESESEEATGAEQSALNRFCEALKGDDDEDKMSAWKALKRFV